MKTGLSTLETQRAAMIDFIVSVEARRGKDGKLRVYKLPPADGGGTYEVAGINDRYHPGMAAHLKRCIEQGWHDRAEMDIRAYLADYTAVAAIWAGGCAAVEAFLRDCAFNRGPKGALRILQLAIGAPDDGKYGPATKAAFKDAMQSPAGLIKRLRLAREKYERRVAPPVGKRAALWPGLVNRWDAAARFAASLL